MRSKNVSLLIFLSGIFLATGCNKQSMDNVHIVHTRGIDIIYNMSRSNYMSNALSDTSTAIAAEQGDILFCKYIGDKDVSNMIMFQYSGQPDEVLTVKPDPTYPFKITINNGDLFVSLLDTAAWQWMGNAGKDELKQLQSLMINLPVTNEQMAVLTGVSKLKPNIGLGLLADTITTQYDSIFSMFKPEWIYLSTGQTFSSDQFSRLSDLKYMLFDHQGENTQTFEGLSQLTHLQIGNSPWKRLDQYNIPQNIRSLYFTGCSLADISTLTDYKNMEALGFSNCIRLLDIRPVIGMKHLKWLACPPNIDQTQFDSLIPTLSSLQVLELIGCDSLTNIEVVNQLPALKSLTVKCKKIDPATIPAMDKLQLLVIEAGNDSITDNWVVALQQKFPGTTVVPGGGFCLGSGWLLLLIPMVLLLMFAFRKLKPASNG